MKSAKSKRFTIGALVLSALGLSVAVGLFERDMRVARARIASGTIAETECGPIEYASVGTGPPVLIVHGAGGGYDQGLEFGAPLIERGYRVIAMSRFGYLRTPLRQDASPAAQADAHRCLLDALHIPKVAVIGISAGASSAVQFALRHRDRCSSMILGVPALYVPRNDDKPSVTPARGTQFLFDTALRSNFLLWLGLKLSPDALIRSIVATPPKVVDAANESERARVDRMLEHILPVTERRLGLLNDSAVLQSIERYPLESISTPTLTLSVKDDLFGTFDAARYTADHIADAQFVGYETGGHLFVGHQDEVMTAIVQFLDRTAIAN